jgi:3-deoxy-D-manno-octulosonic-acid transferase
LKNFYLIIIHFLEGLLKGFAFFNPKINEMIQGRKQQKAEILSLKSKKSKRIWIHAASLGEYEMAIPLIQKMAQNDENLEFIISFFSSSGYKNAKLEPNCKKFYLPFDTQSNAKFWYRHVQPDVVVFVKYEFWPIFINYAHQLNIPVWYWNFSLRQNHFIFKKWAGFWRNSLKKCRGFFCSNEETEILAKQLGLKNIKHIGDIRYLRTKLIQENLGNIPLSLIEFTKDQNTLILGSSWHQEELALLNALTNFDLPINHKIMIAPHDISDEHISGIELQFKDYNIQRFSNFEGQKNTQIVIINNIGLLSKLYALAQISVIGGAFGKGLHNIIESAAAGVPVIFGPNTSKFPEASEFIAANIGFKAANIEEMSELIQIHWLKKDLQETKIIKSKTSAFFAQNVPQIDQATQIILEN